MEMDFSIIFFGNFVPLCSDMFIVENLKNTNK